jgi:CubicO group peptidase (beta-lactamase class C family)
VLNKKWLIWLAVPPFLLGLFVVGLFVYVNATVTPIHPDPQQVPSRGPQSAPQQWTAAVEQARQAARTSVTEQNLPGMSVAVGARGGIVWAEGFGWADLEKKTPVGPATRFAIGTASVALTSAAAGVLLEKERLHLDSEIQTYVPGFPEKQWPVTLRHLMGHTAGVRNDAGDEEPTAQRCERTADGLKRFEDSPLRFEPGAEFRFSSYGWVLVSAAIEAAAGEPLFTVMRKEVFEPLGMRDTTAGPTTDADVATYYFPRFGADPRYGPQAPEPFDSSCLAGAGAFLSTPSDLVRFALAIDGGKLLKPATVHTLQSSQRLASGEETGYGLGWDLETATIAGKETRVVGHDGTLRGGMVSSLVTLPEHGVVVAVASNTSFADTYAIALKIADAFAPTASSPAIPPRDAPRD